MATKTRTDFMKAIEDTFNSKDSLEPIVQLSTVSEQLKVRTQRKIKVLEDKRKLFNEKVDKAIALEKTVLKNIDTQLGKIDSTGTGAKRIISKKTNPKLKPRTRTVAKKKTTVKKAVAKKKTTRAKPNSKK